MAILNSSLFLNLSKTILDTFGLWPRQDAHIFRKMYLIFIMSTQYSFVILEIIYIGVVWGNLGAVSEASYLLFTQASVCYKTTLFLINKKYLLLLMEHMEIEIFQPQSDNHMRILSRLSRIIRRLCLFFMANALTTVSLWAIVPFFDKGEIRSFPFLIWMPLDPQLRSQYLLGYVYQVMSIYFSCLLFIGVDSVSTSMMMFGCAQLEIIADKLGKIKNVQVKMKTREEVQEILQENNEQLIECIKQHQSVTRFLELLENTYHGVIFFQLLGTVAIICDIGLQISMADDNSVQLFSMLVYMVTMLSQLFMYCWCGHELTIRSEDLRDVLYLCPWYEQDIRYRRVMWLTMERMKRPIVFRAGHYIPLSRPTFVAILRCSYSYFAVLNRTRSK